MFVPNDVVVGVGVVEGSEGFASTPLGVVAYAQPMTKDAVVTS